MGLGGRLSSLAAEGARGVVVADLDAEGGNDSPGHRWLAITTDVMTKRSCASSRKQSKRTAYRFVLRQRGMGGPAGGEVPNDVWQQIWDVNVMAHVYSARAVLPGMLARGVGYLLHTASAAGQHDHVETAPYSVTKRGCGVCQWLSIAGDAGIKVSCLCPLEFARKCCSAPMASESFLLAGAIEAEDVAEAVVAGWPQNVF
jgi:NADP-dependent 3-hydroxy acid dehydrogenase YdfG